MDEIDTLYILRKPLTSAYTQVPVDTGNMRIVHVSNFYGPLSGGVRTTMHELGAGYVRAGHEFVMVVPGQVSSRQETPFGTRITAASLPLGRTGYRVIPLESGVRRVLSDLRPDRLEVSDRLTLRRLGVWARGNGVPAVMFSHEKLSDRIRLVSPASPNSRRTTALPMVDRLNRASLRNHDRVICTTDYAAEDFTRLMPGRVEKISLGVDLEGFSPQRWSAEVRARFLGDANVLLVAAGRLSPEKAPQRSIDTLRQLLRRRIRARLMIVGDGPLRERLERSAAGLPVTFLGHVNDRRMLEQLFASADVSLNPGPIETFCLAALEALASGTPVVAANSSALPELLTKGAGVATGSSSHEFADAVEEVLGRSVEERRTAARSRAAEFPWTTTVRRMLELHGSLG